MPEYSGHPGPFPLWTRPSISLKIQNILGNEGEYYEGYDEEYMPSPDNIPITIAINEPRIQIIEVGRTARFNCNVMSQIQNQVTY